MNTEDGYKPVELIELHDAGVVVHLNRYSDAVNGWSGDPKETGKVFRFDGHNFVPILRAFGIEPQTWMEQRTVPGGEKRTLRASIEHECFDLSQCSLGVGRGYEDTHIIEELHARERDGALDVRTVCWYESEGEKHYYQQQLTYRGSYTVWWALDSYEVER